MQTDKKTGRWKPLLQQNAIWTGYEEDHSLEVSLLRIEHFVHPILKNLAVHRVLEVGCGNGIGPFALRALDYEAFGLDPHFDQDAIWEYDFLRIGRGESIPFEECYFDLVYSLETVEHVGTSDGMLELAPRYRECREQFFREICRVARQYVVITTPNRLFPVDEHGTDKNGRAGFRIHSPFEKKTFSVRELKLAFEAQGFTLISFLNPAGYYQMERIRRVFGKWFVILAKSLLKLTSNRYLGGTFLNPHLFLLFERKR
jgi:SAM-dependent methyltransferase